MNSTTHRPRLRQTIRTRHAALLYHDRKRNRFVVYRRAGGVVRKTSVRYGFGGRRERLDAFVRADQIATRLKAWPAAKLSAFKF